MSQVSAATIGAGEHSELRRGAIGLREVLFQSITAMAPGAAIAASIPAGAAYAGIIPDVVPAQQFGKASGFLATMTQLGIGGGLGVTSLMGSSRVIYVVFIVVILLTLVPTIWAAR